MEYLPSTIEAREKKKAPKNKKRRCKTKRELSLFWNISPLHKSRLAKKKKAPSKQKEKVDSKYMKKEARVREKVIKKKSRLARAPKRKREGGGKKKK